MVRKHRKIITGIFLGTVLCIFICTGSVSAVSNLKATDTQQKIIAADIGRAVKKHSKGVSLKNLHHTFPVTWCGYNSQMEKGLYGKCNDSLAESYFRIPFAQSWKVKPYANFTYMATTDCKGRITLKSKVTYLNLSPVYRFSKKKTAVYDRKFRKSYLAARKKCKGKTKSETIRKTYDYIASTTEYSLNTSENRNVYGCLVQKKSCCEGFTYGFRMILESYGIKTRNVANSRHMWTQVLIGGKWKNFDLSSASANWKRKSDRYLFYNKTNVQFRKLGRQEQTDIYNTPYSYPKRNFAQGH